MESSVRFKIRRGFCVEAPLGFQGEVERQSRLRNGLCVGTEAPFAAFARDDSDSALRSHGEGSVYLATVALKILSMGRSFGPVVSHRQL